MPHAVIAKEANLLSRTEGYVNHGSNNIDKIGSSRFSVAYEQEGSADAASTR